MQKKRGTDFILISEQKLNRVNVGYAMDDVIGDVIVIKDLLNNFAGMLKTKCLWTTMTNTYDQMTTMTI